MKGRKETINRVTETLKVKCFPAPSVVPGRLSGVQMEEYTNSCLEKGRANKHQNLIN